MNGTAASSALYVDAEGGEDFTTIQAAINNASPGDTIIVYPGTYTENVNANVENITIRSLSGNPEDTIVVHVGSGSNFNIDADSVTISGFNITGTDSTGIYMSGISGANITNNKFSGIGCGVQMESSGMCSLISNTVIDSAQHGFYLESSSDCIISNNVISDTGEEGILLENSVNCTLTNNTISNTEYDSIYLYYSGSCVLTGNSISNSYDNGISLYDSGSCSLAGNAISGSYNGIELNSSSNCNITDNIISYSWDDGIDLDSSGNCNITDNTITDAEDDGIDLNSSSNCDITGNTVSNIEEDGICLEYSEGCSLINNTISNTSFGIYLAGSDGSTLRNNTASSGTYGISLWGNKNCTLTENVMSGNRYNFDYDIYEISDFENASGNIIDTSNLVDGKAVYFFENEPDPLIGNDAGVIYCINCGNVEIKDLVLQNNTYGVFLYNTSSEMQNNTINNTIYGTMILCSQDVRLSGSRIENSMAGIILEEAMDTTLTDNTVRVSFFGIEAAGSENCTFTNNSIQNSTFVGIATISSGNSTLENNSVRDFAYYGIITLGSENCTLAGNSVQGSMEYYGLTVPESMNLIRSGDNSLISENDLINSDLVQYVAPYGYGIYSLSSGNLRLENNTIDQILKTGIHLGNCQNAQVVGNSVQNIGEVGINLSYSSGICLLDNTVQNVTGEHLFVAGTSSFVSGSSTPSGYGIYFDTSQNVNLVSNSIRDIGNVGVYSYNSSGVDILNNMVQNVTDTSFTVFSGLKESPLTGSNLVQVSEPSGVGILFLQSQDLRFENNTIDQINNEGILLGMCQDIEFVNNLVQNIGDVGIYLVSSSGIDFLDNTVQNVTDRAILYDSGLKESPLTGSNLVQLPRPSGVGILSVQSQDLTFENSVIGQIDNTGIFLMRCQDAELVRSSVCDVGYMGIYTGGSFDVDLLDNTVQNVTGKYELRRSVNLPFVSSPLVSDGPDFEGYGIGSDYSENIRLEGNTVKDCYQVWGIYLYEPVNTTLKGNTLENCKIGLAAYDGDNCSISDCSVTNCTSGGILIENIQEGTGTEYTVTGCTVGGSEIGLLVTGESILAGNTLSGNSYGLVLYDMNNSFIYDNTMVENSLAGMAIDLDQNEIWTRLGLVGSMEYPESGNNTIYNNHFKNINNTLINSEANNTWNISKTSGESIVGGPYLGGNYWANPNGTGFSETCTDADKDGIADSSYEIVNGTFDYLPLKIIPTPHKSSANYIPSSGNSGVTGVDSAQKRVAAGTPTSFNFNNPVSGILGLSFTSQQYSGNVIVRIEVLGEGASGEAPEGEVYRLMNILVGNERFESGNNVNGASINFRVSKSWIEENNIDVSTIAMNRFHNDEWNALPTEMTGEDEEYYYFTAETPGFSRYAITGDKLGTQTITPAEEEETGTITGDKQTNEDKSTPGFESAFAVLGILASVFFAKKRIIK